MTATVEVHRVGSDRKLFQGEGKKTGLCGDNLGSRPQTQSPLLIGKAEDQYCTNLIL